MRSGAAPGPATSEAETLLLRGLEQHRAGRLEAAEALYAKALALAPDHPDALHLAGVAAAQRDDHARAETLIAAALRRAPDVADYHNNLGLALKNLGRPEEAMTCWHRALALRPGFAEAEFNLGSALNAAGDSDGSAQAFHRALASAPDYPHAMVGLASHLFEARDYAAAERLLGRAAAIAPALFGYGAHCSLGDGYEAAADPDRFTALLTAMPAVAGERPAAERPGPIVFAAMDQRYFSDYGRALALSAARFTPGLSVHLHVMNPGPGFAAEAAALKRRAGAIELTLGWEEGAPAKRAYYANVRLARLAAIVAATGRDALMLDADSLIRRDIAPLLAAARGADVTLFTRFAEVVFGTKVLASALHVRASDAG
ncbi:MAG: tetratricopeptide repeat protein, partial [Alphaproteobacteria bacterium]|nr:tetratricopeptide repeat protein [Alphaproteobacteria bacterium]